MVTSVRSAAVPAPEQAQAMLVRFFYSIAAMTAHLAYKKELWIERAAAEAAGTVGRQLDILYVMDLLNDFDNQDEIALSILFREIIFAIRTYDSITREYFPAAPEIDEEFYPEIAPAPAREITKADVERVEVIHGSIEKLFDKLPPWFKRIMDVAMELLKLARGITD